MPRTFRALQWKRLQVIVVEIMEGEEIFYIDGVTRRIMIEVITQITI